MSSEQLSTRILSEQARIKSNDIRRGKISDEQFDQFLETSKNIAELPLFIDETPAISIAAMSNRARRIKRLTWTRHDCSRLHTINEGFNL